MAICELLHAPYLLTFLTMGVTVASTSDIAEEISESLDRMISLLCVVFFVIHGAAMDLNKLWAAGVVGLAYITLRCAGKYFGVFFAADAHRDGPQVKQWLGAALLSQAGAAIALSAIAVHRDKALGQPLQDIILGTVVFFEIVGPIMVRLAVLRGGEVPVAVAILHTSSSPIEQLRSMAFRILESLGISPLRGGPADDLSVIRVTRRNVKPLQAGNNFDEVLNHIEDSYDNTYPVVNDENELIGVIRYADMRDVLFEPTASQLITAEDLTVPADFVLKQTETLGRAWQLLSESPSDCVPVVTDDSPHQYLGVIRQRDLLRLVSQDASKPQAAD
jgi:CBS domain-containing protein